MSKQAKQLLWGIAPSANSMNECGEPGYGMSAERVDTAGRARRHEGVLSTIGVERWRSNWTAESNTHRSASVVLHDLVGSLKRAATI